MLSPDHTHVNTVNMDEIKNFIVMEYFTNLNCFNDENLLRLHVIIRVSEKIDKSLAPCYVGKVIKSFKSGKWVLRPKGKRVTAESTRRERRTLVSFKSYERWTSHDSGVF